MSEMVLRGEAQEARFTQNLAQQEAEARVNIAEQSLAETCELFAAVCNHEAKIATLLAMWKEHTTLSEGELGRAVNNRQLPGEGWRPSSGRFIDYCADSLEPAGLVIGESTKTARGVSEGYRLSKGGEAMVAPAALVGDWSLRHPDLSVQQLLGSTNSAGEVRAPQTRVQILLELLTNPDESVSVVEIVGKSFDSKSYDNHDYDLAIKRVDKGVRALGLHGFVTRESIDDENLRRFEVVDPDYPPEYQPRGLITKGTYAFIQERYQAGQPIFTLDEAVAYVEPWVHQYDPEIATDRIRHQVNCNLVYPATVPGVVRRDMDKLQYHTKITLNPEHRDAVEELVAIVLAVDAKDRTALARGHIRAQEIVTDKTAMAALMEKAYKFSQGTHKRPKVETLSNVKTVLENSDDFLRVDEIVQRFRDDFGRTISPDRMRVLLQELEKAETIAIKEESNSESVKRLHKVYGRLGLLATQQSAAGS